MNTLGGITIENDQYGMPSSINNANINGGTISGANLFDGVMTNPQLNLSEDTIISIGAEYFTAKELFETVKAIKALREIYPEHFI